MIAVAAVKEVSEDLQRRQDDHQVNSRAVERFDGPTGIFRPVTWRDVKQGDVVRVRNDQMIPADLLLLAEASRQVSLSCYI